jgi:hypothetical protein
MHLGGMAASEAAGKLGHSAQERLLVEQIWLNHAVLSVRRTGSPAAESLRPA